MKYLIVSRQNGFGLDQDVRILKHALAAVGIDADVAKPRDRGFVDIALRRKVADCIIHVERVHTRWLGAATQHFVIPNQERFPARKLRALRRVDLVLAKTHQAETIFSSLGLPTRYLGFASEDCALPDIAKDYRRFLHLAGRSFMKGTEEVVAAWARHPEWPQLTLVQDPSRPAMDVPENVTLMRTYLSQRDLRVLQNSCGIHLCPSRSEGWGHYIWEAMSTGAVVLTTDGPPMNEMVDETVGFLVPHCRAEARHLGTCYVVDEDALAQRIDALLSLPDAAKAELGRAGRRRYDDNGQRFHDRIRELFGGPRRGGQGTD